MKKIYLFIILQTIFIFSCNNKVLKYDSYTYKKDFINDGVWYTIIEKILSEEECSNSVVYASQYVCQREGQKELLRIFTVCRNIDYDDGTLVLFLSQDDYNDNGKIVKVASSREMQDKYGEIPFVFGMLTIPDE